MTRISQMNTKAKVGLVGLVGLMLAGTLALPGAQLWLNRGNAANDDTGDTPRTFLGKANTNFTEVYAACLVMTNMPFIGTLWIQTNQVSMQPSTAEQSLITNALTSATAGIGNLMVGSNNWATGRTLHLYASGTYNLPDGGAGVLAWKIGSAVLLSNLPVSLPAGPTDFNRWKFDGRITVRRLGISAAVYGSGYLSVSTNGFIPIEVSSTINTTTNALIDFTWRHTGASAPPNAITCDQVVIRGHY